MIPEATRTAESAHALVLLILEPQHPAASSMNLDLFIPDTCIYFSSEPIALTVGSGSFCTVVIVLVRLLVLETQRPVRGPIPLLGTPHGCYLVGTALRVSLCTQTSNQQANHDLENALTNGRYGGNNLHPLDETLDIRIVGC